MSEPETQVTVSTGGVEVLFSGTVREFGAACRKAERAVKRKGRKVPKDEQKMKETEGDIHVRDRTYKVTASHLRSFVERIERLNEDKAEISEAIKDIYGEAKSGGYNTKCIRKLISERKRDATEVDEEQAIMELYREALGR